MNLVSIEKNKNNLVVKHKDLIWEARYRLSELGLKVVAILISMIKINDEDFKEYHLRINDLKELINSDSKKVYEYVDILTNELMSNPFKIGDEKFNWVYYAKYHKGENYVILKIAPELKTHLLQIKEKFVKYNIINILPLKSPYVIRLYEILKSKLSEYTHYNKSKSLTFELKINWLREHFKIPESYQYSSHIKKRIIEKAQKQFKEKTDITFTYKEQKIGRKVDRLIITVKENSKGSSDFLASRISFIKHIRGNYVNEILVRSRDKNTNETVLISVAKNGTLYNQKTTETYTAKEGNTLWDWLYESAKDNKLEILREGDKNEL